MRAASLSLLVLLAFACHPCSAQQAGSGGGKSDDALSPSTLPKAREKVTETPRIDSLSPDEERRLGRVRTHAAGGTPAGGPASESHAASPAAAPTSKAAAKSETPVKSASPVQSASPAKTVTPVASKATSPAPSRKQAANAHRDRRHTAKANRDTADLDERRRARPTRRTLAEEREPRAGDSVPPVFHPYPPGYEAPDEAGPLPFPGQRDEADDDFGPPRHMFVPPY